MPATSTKGRFWLVAAAIVFAVFVAVLYFSYPAISDYQSRARQRRLERAAQFLQAKALSYRYSHIDSECPADLQETIEPDEWPRNCYTGEPMRNVDFGADDRSGNFTYYTAERLKFSWTPPRAEGDTELFLSSGGELWPRAIDRQPRGCFYLIIYGNADFAGLDLNLDGRPDNVVHVYSQGYNSKFPPNDWVEPLLLVMREQGVDLGPVPADEAEGFYRWNMMLAWSDELQREQPRDIDTWLQDYWQSEYEQSITCQQADNDTVPGKTE